ncbi:hypothetical protein, partial [Bradyrhizobium canariense]|uniref:hypothetical protein n=1 Tax=Bradyrhizobium canariense TaxID=255045 RepID=UPI001AEC9134
RLGSPAAFILITSRTRRIASLSVGIQGPLRKAERVDPMGARRGLVTRATSSRNGGRDHLGILGDIDRNPQTLLRRISGGWQHLRYVSPVLSRVHFLDDRIEQHEDRQEDEEPNGLWFVPGKFTVRICFRAERHRWHRRLCTAAFYRSG